MAAKQLSFASLEPKKEITSFTTDEITHAQIVRYAGASGDFNPIHNDPEFAKKMNLPGTIAHGMLVMGLIGRMISGYTDPKFVKNFNVKFVGMTTPGEAITLSSVVKKIQEVDGKKLATIAVVAVGPDGKPKTKGDITVECS